MIRLPFAVIPLALGTIATGNERSQKPASQLGLFKHIGLTWSTNGASNAWVRGDFGSAQDIDFAAVLCANAQPGTTLRLRLGSTQAEVDGTAPYDSTALPFISPAIVREDGLYHSHLELPSTVSARWWRIDFGSHTGDFEAAFLVLGKRLTPDRYYDNDFEFAVQDMGDLSFGRWGVPEEEDGVVMRSLQLKFSWLSREVYEQAFRPMAEKLGKRGMVYWCFDPDPTAYRQAKTYFGKFKDSPVASGGILPGTFTNQFQILSLI